MEHFEALKTSGVLDNHSVKSRIEWIATELALHLATSVFKKNRFAKLVHAVAPNQTTTTNIQTSSTPEAKLTFVPRAVACNIPQERV
jgi:hypothetical protein